MNVLNFRRQFVVKRCTAIVVLALLIGVPVQRTASSATNNLSRLTASNTPTSPHLAYSIVHACQEDGATIATAMAAFEAQNPQVVPTRSLLLGRRDGGPYLQGWAHYPPFYSYAVSSHGQLLISIPANSSPSIYGGPSNCTILKTATPNEISIDQSCQADGSTITVAIEAFEAQNPQLIPNKSRLLGRKFGGPYLQSWTHSAPYYAFNISGNGHLLVSIPSNSKSAVVYNPNRCNSFLTR